MQSISACSSTWSPGLDTGAAIEIVPFDWKTTFIHRFTAVGTARGGSTPIAQRTMEVVGTGPVIGRRAELAISLAVARRDERVVDAWRRVLEQAQDRPPQVGDEHVAGSRREPEPRIAGVRHRHRLEHVVCCHRPQIDDL